MFLNVFKVKKKSCHEGNIDRGLYFKLHLESDLQKEQIGLVAGGGRPPNKSLLLPIYRAITQKDAFLVPFTTF